MKVTKFIHSCLLVKTENVVYLIDPGQYSYQSKTLNLDKIENIDYILITHEHQDHMDLSFIKEVLEKFPNVKIHTNPSAAEILNNEGINTLSDLPDEVSKEEVDHEAVFGSKPPENLLYTIDGYLTHPGDSYHFENSAKVLCLPVQAPWGSLVQAVELAISLKPKVIIPIHDWHWRKEAKEAFYKRLEGYFAEKDIKFIPIEDGVEVEV